jgi:metal transporter CNNM
MGWFLDHFFGKKVECGVFTNDQLESLIKYHERGEQNGGQLGQDATRIMTGALKLDGRTIGNEMTRVVDLAPECCEKDIEKAIVVVQGIVVKWSAVKTIKIDDIVNEAFIQKIKGWSYSRIPVISKADVGIWNDNQSKWEDWDGTRIYGFLHTKVRVFSSLE